MQLCTKIWSTFCFHLYLESASDHFKAEKHSEGLSTKVVSDSVKIDNPII